MEVNLRGKQLVDAFRGHFANFIAAQEAEKRVQAGQFAATNRRVLSARIVTSLGLGVAIGWLTRPAASERGRDVRGVGGVGAP